MKYSKLKLDLEAQSNISYPFLADIFIPIALKRNHEKKMHNEF